MNGQRRPRAFTLIELLVVITIIVILAAILFPVFASAREKARQAACISNVGQIALAIQMYVQDYDQTFPIFQMYDTLGYNGQPAPPWTAGHLGVEMELLPYVKSHAVFDCPDDDGDPQTSPSYYAAFGSSYRFDQACYTQVAGPDGSRQNDLPAADPNGNPLTQSIVVTDSMFVDPAGTRIMRDEEMPWFSPQIDPGGAKYGYVPPGSGGPNYYKPWHPDGGGFVFADGHGKFVVSESVFDNMPSSPDGRSYNSTPQCWWACD